MATSSSKAPISHSGPWGRATPRWSMATELPSASVQVPVLIAGPPCSRAWVSVWPPLLASGSRIALPGRPIVSLPVEMIVQPALFPNRLWPNEVTTPEHSAPVGWKEVLPAMIVPITVAPWKASMPLPTPRAEFPVTVLWLSTGMYWPEAIPPPLLPALLPETVLLATDNLAELEIPPPPPPTAVLRRTALPVIVMLPDVPRLWMPPPLLPAVLLLTVLLINVT